jgi:two-component system LytT family response regulator
LRHALENLLSNALKYSEGPVLVCLAITAHGYRIEVRDTGIGIPVEEQASIFEAYFRGSNTGGRPGHGLGLCVARSCIQDHGGTLQFVSHPKQGTTFLIDLPASPQPMPPEPQFAQRPFSIEAQPAQAFSKSTAKLRAIVIEDDPVVRNVLRDLLEDSDDVLVLGETATVAQARLLVRQHKPDVLFLDVNLPDGLGFDLLPDLEATTSVVFVTSAEEYAVQAFDCEATDYLVKPVSSDRLQKTIQRVRQRLARQDAVEPVADSRLTGSFLIKTLTEKRLVKISEIKSVIAYGEYSWVYWDKTTKGALLRKSLKRWQSELPREQFVRVHRRAIVNLAFMERVERLPSGRLQIHLRDYKDPILVSLSQTPVLNRHLKTSRRWQPAAPHRNEILG